MNHHSPVRISLVVSALLLPLAAGCAVTESELLQETQQSLAEGLGEACEIEPDLEGYELDGSESIVSDDDRSGCGTDLDCIGMGADVAAERGVEPTNGTCSCRCDGPKDAGPYCRCADGFVCTLLIEDLGHSFGEMSYCALPAESDSRVLPTQN